MHIKPLSAPKLIFLVAGSYTIALLVFSLINTNAMNMPSFTYADKVFHATAYCGLTLVWYLYYYSKCIYVQWNLKPLLIISLLTIGFGIFIEVLQWSLTSYRSFDVYDMLANSVGAILSFLLLSIKKWID